MNEDALILQVCKGVSDGERLHYVVSFPKIKAWYLQAKMVKSNIEFSYKKLGKRVPYSIKNLSEHKLCVECNANNDVVTARGCNYPEVRWYTVITVSRINPNEELEIELMRFTKKFQLYAAAPSFSEIFMNWEYVVLSRVRTIIGLFLIRPISMKKLFKPLEALTAFFNR